MYVVTIPSFGKIFNCGRCRLSYHGDALYLWKQQDDPQELTIKVRDSGNKRYRSSKPCPECGRAMWALQEPGYGTRHQCEECRLTVLFGGAVARWRTPKRPPATSG
jgi:hypothetical protein